MPCRRQPNNFRRPPSSTPGSIRRSMNAPLVDNDEPMLWVDDGTGNYEGTVRDPDFASIGTGSWAFNVRALTASASLAAGDFVDCDGGPNTANIDFTLPAASSNSGKEIIVRVENAQGPTYTVKVIRSGSDTIVPFSGTGTVTEISWASTTTASYRFVSNGSDHWYYETL